MRDLARHVRSRSRLPRVAENQPIDSLRVKLSRMEHAFDRGHSKIGGAE